MVLLQNNIFCKKKIYDYATGSSTVSSHLARRFLEGVFKQETLLKSTFSGQSPRTQGRQRQRENVECLHNTAKHAIIGNFNLICFIINLSFFNALQHIGLLLVYTDIIIY